MVEGLSKKMDSLKIKMQLFEKDIKGSKKQDSATNTIFFRLQ
jgi:hypothetical protein